jgi:Protein of unknown function (DUF1194)
MVVPRTTCSGRTLALPWHVTAAPEVDVALVLAADVSGSVSDARERMQRQGYAAGLLNPAFLGAVRSGRLGRIAVLYFEWSTQDRQIEAMDWAVIADAASAEILARAILVTPRMTPGFTSISGAIDFGVRRIRQSGFMAARLVIDVSGDGRNNDGREARAARDAAVASGITVNGLPMLEAEPDLESYYRAEVIGGPLAFAVPVPTAESIATAVLRKLVTEVAGMNKRPAGQDMSDMPEIHSFTEAYGATLDSGMNS